MQPGSMVGAQVSSVTACLSIPQQQELNTRPEHNMSSQLDQANHNQPHHVMDDFLEQIWSIPPAWADVGGGKAPWDYNGNAELSQNNPKIFTMSLMPSGIDPVANQGLSYTTAERLRDGENQLRYSFDDSFFGSRLQHQRKENLIGTQENPQTIFQLSTGNASASQLLATIGNSTCSPVVLTRSPSSAGSSGSEGSATHQTSTCNIPPPAQAWRASDVGGMLPLSRSLCQGIKPELLQRMGTSGTEDRLLGKRLRDIHEDTVPANSSRDIAHSVGRFTTLVDHPVQAIIRPNNQSSLIPQAGQGVSFQSYGAQPQHHQPPVAAAPAPTPAPARPRVRARRGQATDPHSIAERQRRERIAERMKALQELVPNSNKTDKASMLDDILEYVKFLQLQVKVLSMSRLGGAGAVAPLNVAAAAVDIPASSEEATRNNGAQSPSKDELALTERQVAKLMKEDMGSAMQYLQGKGLCLMPLSLATAMSGTGSRPQGGLHNPISSPPSGTAESSSMEGNAAPS